MDAFDYVKSLKIQKISDPFFCKKCGNELKKTFDVVEYDTQTGLPKKIEISLICPTRYTCDQGVSCKRPLTFDEIKTVLQLIKDSDENSI